MIKLKKIKFFEKIIHIFPSKLLLLKQKNYLIILKMTANHKGYFEFRLCNVDRLKLGEATQSCLNKILLQDRHGRSQIPIIPFYVGIVKTSLKLPPFLTCNHCVFQVSIKNKK